jgi:mannitol/fructose-specific phosphotransferase system IIA component (Ntr-type)
MQLNQTRLHIQVLVSISRVMMNEEFKTSLEDASSVDEVYEIFNGLQE